jgi:hypothetical protein
MSGDDVTYNAGPERLEVRLDPSRRLKIAELAGVYHVGMSELVRKMIDEAYEDVLLARRRAAVQRIIEAQAEGEEMPDPDELSRQLASTYDVHLEGIDEPRRE